MGGHHAAFASGGEDLVLAEAPSSHITEAANRLAAVAGAMGLGAVLDHLNAMGVKELEDRGHPYASTFKVFAEQPCNDGRTRKQNLIQRRLWV
jgi:hypothetical protein